jgi:hypothetical protein
MATLIIQPCTFLFAVSMQLWTCRSNHAHSMNYLESSNALKVINPTVLFSSPVADIIVSTEHTIDGRVVDVKRAVPRDLAPAPTRCVSRQKIISARVQKVPHCIYWYHLTVLISWSLVSDTMNIFFVNSLDLNPRKFLSEDSLQNVLRRSSENIFLNSGLSRFVTSSRRPVATVMVPPIVLLLRTLLSCSLRCHFLRDNTSSIEEQQSGQKTYFGLFQRQILQLSTWILLSDCWCWRRITHLSSYPLFFLASSIVWKKWIIHVQNCLLFLQFLFHDHSYQFAIGCCGDGGSQHQ